MERRLAAEGNAFRTLLDGSLRRRFESAISEPDMTADRMADRLGYHDGSSLQRACRRWFGQPFSVVRSTRA
jgi:AraC-like DNA-binding protein